MSSSFSVILLLHLTHEATPVNKRTSNKENKGYSVANASDLSSVSLNRLSPLLSYGFYRFRTIVR